MGDRELLQDLWTRAADRRSRLDRPHGLIVTADRTGTEICVQFGAQGRTPAPLEINILLTHLPVPSTVQPVHEVARNGYHVVSYRWPNPTPAQPPLAIELAPIVQPTADGADDSLDARFARFHAANPHVFRALESLAMQLYRAGARGFGVKLLVEQLRWQYAIATSGDTFRINNNWPSRYARMLVETHPELRGVIELRELRS